MKACRLRLTGKRTTLLILAGSLLSGCAHFFTPGLPAVKPESELEAVVSNHVYCSGKGQLTVTEPEPLNLAFRYQCVQDSLYLVFKDLLGRKVFYLQFEGDSLVAWDINRNQIYTRLEMAYLIPTIPVEQLAGLWPIFWGYPPSAFKVNGSNFTYETAHNDMLISRVTVKSAETSLFRLQFSSRRLGYFNHQMKLKIPASATYPMELKQ